jgi:hypothetical protein
VCILPQPNVRGIQNAVGGLLGMLLLLHLLRQYHKVLRHFGMPEEMDGETASGRYESDMSMTSFGSSAADTSGAGPEEAPPGISSGGGGGVGGSEAHSLGSFAIIRPPGSGHFTPRLPSTPRATSIKPRSKRAIMLERRLRRALYRVLQLYVATFVCVIIAGIVAIDKQSAWSKVLVLILEIPYSLLGVGDAVVVEGHSMRSRRLSKAAAMERARRKLRMDGVTDEA